MRVVDRRWWARGDDTPAGDEAGVRKPTVVEDLERRLADTTAQLQNVLAEHRRATDEFEQVKVRIRRDVARDVERGRRAVIVELLEVLDNLDRAIAAARATAQTDTSETLLRGVELVREQFLAKLDGLGVARLDAFGARFDPQQHEAVSLAPVEDPAQAGLVVAVLTEGYAIGDEVLRPARVVVGSSNG
jgi:molecular chaperone GrpE